MVFGHLPVLCLGIYLAAQDKVRLRGNILVTALIFFIIGNFNSYFWVIQDLTFTILVLGFSLFIINNFTSRVSLTAPLIFFGGISFHLFMVNGFLRSPFHNFAESSDVWWIDNLAAFGSLTFSTLFAMALSAFDAKLRRVLSKGRKVRKQAG
jgi:peptidoglycan/LPS O-acetylase OafA/YrhL